MNYDKPSVLIRPGYSGGAFRLDRAVRFPAQVGWPWTTFMLRGFPILVTETANSMAKAEAEARSRAKAQIALDVLAVNGAGAYRIARDDPCVNWWSASGKSHASLHGQFHIPIDIGMTIRNLDVPIGGEPASSKVSWSPAFRLFRMGQTAPDYYAAFRETYRATEDLLAKLCPRITEPKREPEKDWLVRALQKFNNSKPTVAGRDWLGRLGLDDFAETIHRAIRHGVFHAKAGEEFFVPLEEESDQAVQRAIVPLTRLFLELAATEMNWPQNERPQIEADFIASGQLLASYDVWPFQDTAVAESPGGLNRTILKVVGGPDQTRTAAGFVETTIGTELLRQVENIDGWVCMLGEKPIAFEELGFRLPTKELDSLTVSMQVTVKPGAMVRTRFD